jgi:oxygen-independent coproporphyrinogen-3 oxidase
MSGLYIHIPFCKQACSYCDFYFITRTEKKGLFVNRLIDEISSFRDSIYTEEPVETVYFGGGTPSLLSPNDLDRIINKLSSVFKTHEVKEITLEMNPDDVTANYLRDLKKLGINRASMGIQSFQPELLEFMHRAHNRDQALRSLEILAKTGFENYTVDLIYGNPGQTLQDLEQDLDILMSYKPPHVSAYSLTVEPRTRLGKMVQMGRISPLDEERISEHMDLVIDKLRSYGIEQYEVSNYSLKGSEAIHNSNYWDHQNYLGFGPAAHSFWWDDSRKKASRWQNKADFKEYISPGNNFEKWKTEQLNLKSLAEERIMLGLRTMKGLPIDRLIDEYDYNFSEDQNQYLQYLLKNNFLKIGDPLRLTQKGIKLADRITLEIISRS